MGLILFLIGLQELRKYTFFWFATLWSIFSVDLFCLAKFKGIQALTTLGVISCLCNLPFYIGYLGYIRNADLCKRTGGSCYGAFVNEDVDASTAYAGAGLQVFSLLAALVVNIEDIKTGHRLVPITNRWFFVFVISAGLNAIGFILAMAGVGTPDNAYLSGVLSSEVSPPFWGLVAGFSVTFGTLLQSRDLLNLAPVGTFLCVFGYLNAYEQLKYVRDTQSTINKGEADITIGLYTAGLVLQFMAQVPFLLLFVMRIMDIDTIAEEAGFVRTHDEDDMEHGSTADAHDVHDHQVVDMESPTSPENVKVDDRKENAADAGGAVMETSERVDSPTRHGDDLISDEPATEDVAI